MGPTLPPQRKGRVPQYSRDKLVELQDKFDELESQGVFARPEDVGVVAEYLNPSFLVKKGSGGHRLVTSFGEVAKYAKPQPALMPDINETLRLIGTWKYIVKTDLSSAYYQIPLSKDSLKFCGVCTPFKGVRVYVRPSMGMPGSETALEQMMSLVVGDLMTEGILAKVADDLFVGGDTPEHLLDNYARLLTALDKANLGLSPAKTEIAPSTTTILGWIWSGGKLSASPHRIATLSSCAFPSTVKQMRSFIGAYKFLARVIPRASDSSRQPKEKADMTINMKFDLKCGYDVKVSPIRDRPGFSFLRFSAKSRYLPKQQTTIRVHLRARPCLRVPLRASTCIHVRWSRAACSRHGFSFFRFPGQNSLPFQAANRYARAST